MNPDQILASLDGDTRDYLQLLVQGAAEGSAADGEELSATLRRFSPLARYLAKINGGLAKRRASIERSITSFKEVSEALGGADTRLAEFVDSSEAVLSSFARQEASLRETFQELPGGADRHPLGARERRHLRPGAQHRDDAPCCRRRRR